MGALLCAQLRPAPNGTISNNRLDIAQAHAPGVLEHAPTVEAPLLKLASHRQASLEAVAPLREKHKEEQAAQLNALKKQLKVKQELLAR